MVALIPRRAKDASEPYTGGTAMAYGIVHHFRSGTREQYEAVLAAIHPSDGSVPDGQIFHSVGASKGGWTIVAVHESKESWERFCDEVLMETLEDGVEVECQSPPDESTVDVYELMPERGGRRRTSGWISASRRSHPAPA